MKWILSKIQTGECGRIKHEAARIAAARQNRNGWLGQGVNCPPLPLYFEAIPFKSNDILLHSHQRLSDLQLFLDTFRVSHGKLGFLTPNMRICIVICLKIISWAQNQLIDNISQQKTIIFWMLRTSNFSIHLYFGITTCKLLFHLCSHSESRAWLMTVCKRSIMSFNAQWLWGVKKFG